MASNWLDLMDNDSNLSMTDDENTKPGMGLFDVFKSDYAEQFISDLYFCQALRVCLVPHSILS